MQMRELNTEDVPDFPSRAPRAPKSGTTLIGPEFMPIEVRDAYTIFQDMGADRSMAVLATQLHQPLALLREWSIRYRWTSLSETYDRTLAEIAFREEVAKHRAAEAEALAKRLNWANRLQDLGMEVIESAAAEGTISAAVALQMIRDGNDTQRRELSELPDKLIHVQIDLNHMSNEELERIARGEHIARIGERVLDQIALAESTGTDTDYADDGEFTEVS